MSATESVSPPSDRLESILFFCAALLLVLVLMNIMLARANAAVSRDIAVGQQQINEGVRLGRINGQVVRAIATLAANSSDAELQLLLARHGITYSVTPRADAEESKE